MVNSPFHTPPVRPRDLFEAIVEIGGDRRPPQSTVDFKRPRSSQKKLPLIVKVSGWVICLSLGIIGLAVWRIIGQLTTYWL
jgi:hypothetical protein